jgi:CBS domain-containing protein
MGKTLADIMSRKVATAGVGERVSDIASRMADRQVSCAVVIDDGAPVGIVSERDFVRLVARHPQDPGRLCARDIMSAPVLVLPASSSVSEAKSLMADWKVRHFPVTDASGTLIGIVTQTDVLRACSVRPGEPDLELPGFEV